VGVGRNGVKRYPYFIHLLRTELLLSTPLLTFLRYQAVEQFFVCFNYVEQEGCTLKLQGIILLFIYLLTYLLISFGTHERN